MKIEDVISYFKGYKGIAKACGCSVQAVWKWGETVPHLRQYQIEVITSGVLKSDYSINKIQRID